MKSGLSAAKNQWHATIPSQTGKLRGKRMIAVAVATDSREGNQSGWYLPRITLRGQAIMNLTGR